MVMSTFTFKLRAELKAEFCAAAKKNGVNPSALLRELMRQEVSRAKGESHNTVPEAADEPL